MKKIVFALFAFSTYVCSAQKIRSDNFDQFTKMRRVETTELPLKTGLSNSLKMSYRSAGDMAFLKIDGMADHYPPTINKGDDIIFLLANDSTVRLTATEFQGFHTTRFFNCEYPISKTNIEAFLSNPVKGVRFYGLKGYQDFAVNKPTAMMELSKVFLAAFNSQ